MPRKKPELKSYLVRMKCTVVKEVVVEGEGLTEERAREDPFGDFHVDTSEVEMTDWKVLSVKENK